MNIKRHAIAERIRLFFRDYDFYEYCDRCETDAYAYNDILETLKHNPGLIIATLEDIVSESDSVEDIKTAKELIADIRETFYL